MKDVGIHIEPQHFFALRRLLSADENFPKTLDEWQKVEALPCRRRVTVNPDEFSLYCRRIGQTPNWYTLVAYAVFKVNNS
jgi:hypothetical protein